MTHLVTLRQHAACALALYVFVGTTAAQTTQPAAAASAPAAAASASASASASAPTQTVTVTGFRREYRTREAGTALGMSADALSTPLAVTVIPKELLADQGITNVEDALRNVAGVTRFKEGNGGQESFSIRGFDSSRNLFIDGAQLNNNQNATSIASTETANIERFEVLKGPSAILFGSGLPGGVINYVTKKPTFKPYAAGELLLGSYGYKRVEADATAPVNEMLAWRAVVSHEDSEGFRDFDSRRRTLINPTLAFRFGSDATLNLGYSYIRDRYTQDRGQALNQAADGSYFYSPLLRPDMFLGIPGWNDRSNSTYQRLNFNFEQRFGDNLRLELLGAATKVRKELFDHEKSPVQPDGTVDVEAFFQGGDAKTRYLRANLEAGFGDASTVEHRVLFSAAEDRSNNDMVFFDLIGDNTLVFDTATRSYSRTGDSFVLDPSTRDTSFFTKDVERTLSLQDLITLNDRHVLLLGLGHTRYRELIDNYSASKTNPRLGYIYKLSPQTSLYANAATGFFPSGATGQFGEYLPPEQMRQVELGFKADLLNQDLLLSGALFNIEERDQAVTDPASLALPPDQQWQKNIGNTRTRGLEVQAIGKLGSPWRLIAGYAFLDAKLIDDGPDLSNDGKRLGGIPRHSLNLWAVYEFGGAWHGLGLGGGVFAQSRVPIGFENRSFYGGWAQVDLAAYYQRDKWKAQLNLKNAGNREYLLTQALAFEEVARGRVGVATPRTFTFSLAKEF
jgi:iron complex outermembrane recepter protein